MKFQCGSNFNGNISVFAVFLARFVTYPSHVENQLMEEKSIRKNLLVNSLFEVRHATPEKTLLMHTLVYKCFLKTSTQKRSTYKMYLFNYSISTRIKTEKHFVCISFEVIDFCITFESDEL